ncbi:MAG: metallophosphoesterase [Desulfovibrio sp.]|nr:metallophosphoesterase [Desulfovibrio sp.]
MLTVFFLAIVIPPIYLSMRLFMGRTGRKWSWRTRLAVCSVLLVISQVYTIDSTVFRNLSGPDMPAWLLLLQIWLFTAMILAFLMCLCGDISYCVWRALGLTTRLLRGTTRQWGRRPDPGRRAFLRQASFCVTWGVSAVSLGTSAVGVVAGTALPQVHRMEVVIPKLPQALDGFCLAQLTDVHIGPLTSIDWVRQIVTVTNAARPDLICLTGDLTDGRWEYQVAHGGSRIGAIREFVAFRARHGVFACTGNHEYYSDYAGWMSLYADVGLRVLHNEGVVLEHDGARLSLAGLDDDMAVTYGHAPERDSVSLMATLPGLAEGALRVVMDHRPVHAAKNAAAGADMQLSGHTHGGQCLGMDKIVAKANRGFVRGWYTVSGMPVYVSSGVGLWSGFPVRLGIPAEIALVTLRSGAEQVIRDVNAPA